MQRLSQPLHRPTSFVRNFELPFLWSSGSGNQYPVTQSVSTTQKQERTSSFPVFWQQACFSSQMSPSSEIPHLTTIRHTVAYLSNIPLLYSSGVTAAVIYYTLTLFCVWCAHTTTCLLPTTTLQPSWKYTSFFFIVTIWLLESSSSARESTALPICLLLSALRLT